MTEIRFAQLFREGERRPIGRWIDAHGGVGFSAEGQVAVVKVGLVEHLWGLANREATDRYGSMRAAELPAEIERIWALEGPLDRFIRASLLTDGRIHRNEKVLEHPQAGAVQALFSNEDWSPETIEASAQALLDRVTAEHPDVDDVPVGPILDLPTRRTSP